jgi:hypothetical protein
VHAPVDEGAPNGRPHRTVVHRRVHFGRTIDKRGRGGA